MASEVWIRDWDTEYLAVYKAHRHWIYNEPVGETFSDWMERNYRCYVSGILMIPNVMFFSPADKTFFLLKWS